MSRNKTSDLDLTLRRVDVWVAAVTLCATLQRCESNMTVILSCQPHVTAIDRAMLSKNIAKGGNHLHD